MLEEEHTRVFGAYKKKIDLKANLLLQNEQIVEEKKALAEQIAKENSGLSEFQVGNFNSMLLLILILCSPRRGTTELLLRWINSNRPWARRNPS